jgi:hypothetical protein
LFKFPLRIDHPTLVLLQAQKVSDRARFLFEPIYFVLVFLKRILIAVAASMTMCAPPPYIFHKLRVNNFCLGGSYAGSFYGSQLLVQFSYAINFSPLATVAAPMSPIALAHVFYIVVALIKLLGPLKTLAHLSLASLSSGNPPRCLQVSRTQTLLAIQHSSAPLITAIRYCPPNPVKSHCQFLQHHPTA